MKPLLLILSILLLSACSNSPTEPIIESETGIEQESQLEAESGTEVEWEAIDSKDYNQYHTEVENPSSGAMLSAYLALPNGTGPFPTIVLVPGGSGAGTGSFSGADRINPFLDEGIAVAYFDIDGRGESEGEENFNGHIGQDGLFAISQSVAAHSQVDEDEMGIVSYSYGVVMASGMLARYADEHPFEFYVDWEGPVDRFYVTVGCPHPEDVEADPKSPARHSCEDEDYWEEREAVNFLAELTIPYQRAQGAKDHVQPNNQHAIDAINAAESAGIWTRINNEAPNQSYSVDNEPEYLKGVSLLAVAEYAIELFSLVD
jgi:pimeloyl-ACP methyl ester carboxylesterase